MATEQQQPTITRGSELCLGSFQQCLQQSASTSPRELSLVEDQIARFSIWTASIGVFAPGRASMDHRLREVPEVQDVVRGLLDALDDSIQNCLAVLKTLDTTQPERSEGDVVVADGKLDRCLRAIAGEINLLHRLANTIRRASKESQNLRASKFRIEDDDGNDAEPLLQQVFANYVLDRFPGIGDVIRERLASTMLQRRKRILYRRNRYGETPIKPRNTISQPTIKFPTTQPQDVISVDENEVLDASEVVENYSQSVVKSMAVSATTLAPDKFKKASTPSVVSASKTIALGNHEDLIFPPAPVGRIKQKYRKLKRQREEDHKAYLKLLQPFDPDMISEQISDADAKLKRTLEQDWVDCTQAIAEVTCPFCFYALPSQDVVDEKKWKAHVKNDLDAYVCLFEDCDRPDELYNHNDEWIKHMSKHDLRWRCNSKSHGLLQFDMETEYTDHMSKMHGPFTKAQLRVLAERNARTIGPLFKSCPFCGSSDVKGCLEDHIVGHLRHLALKSFPPYSDEGSEDSGSEKGSLGLSQPPSRSTIEKDPDRHLVPVFDDIDDQSRFQGVEPAQRNPYSSWGGFRNYISQFHDGMKRPFSGDKHAYIMFPTTHIPDDKEYQPLPWSQDPSILFVEESLFAGILDQDRRCYEWGCVTKAHELLKSLEDDPIIQSILKSKLEGKGIMSGISVGTPIAAGVAALALSSESHIVPSDSDSPHPGTSPRATPSVDLEESSDELDDIDHEGSEAAVDDSDEEAVLVALLGFLLI
ncbi:hypothetical protein BDZ45DRAFT_336280 [Acephala macrosclerotiorum]|nr:hypothetical protein BDZ45DRAFT_336280 [Acephala macrosclerotiorum]